MPNKNVFEREAMEEMFEEGFFFLRRFHTDLAE
jgi:hypothetical protein